MADRRGPRQRTGAGRPPVAPGAGWLRLLHRWLDKEQLDATRHAIAASRLEDAELRAAAREASGPLRREIYAALDARRAAHRAPAVAVQRSAATRRAVSTEPAQTGPGAVLVDIARGVVAVYGDPTAARKLLAAELGPVPAAMSAALLDGSAAQVAALPLAHQAAALLHTWRDSGRLYTIARESLPAVKAAGGLPAGQKLPLLPITRDTRGRVSLVGLNNAGTGIRVAGQVTGIVLVAFHVIGNINLHKRLASVERAVGRVDDHLQRDDIARVLVAWERLDEFWQVYQERGEEVPDQATLALLPNSEELRILAKRTALHAEDLTSILDPERLPNTAQGRRLVLESVQKERRAVLLNVATTVAAQTSEKVLLHAQVHADGSMASPAQIAAAERRHAHEWRELRDRRDRMTRAVGDLGSNPGTKRWWQSSSDRTAVKRAVKEVSDVLEQSAALVPEPYGDRLAAASEG